MKLGLCQGRHEMPVDDYIFEHTIKNPFDFKELEDIVHNKLMKVEKLDLYISGLTPILIVVVNYCITNAIDLTLFHYDIKSGEYMPQKIERS
jgi:hypothetical protein